MIGAVMKLIKNNNNNRKFVKQCTYLLQADWANISLAMLRSCTVLW